VTASSVFHKESWLYLWTVIGPIVLGPTTPVKTYAFVETVVWVVNRQNGSRYEGLPIVVFFLILIAFITGNSSLEPLIEGLCAQIHVNLR